MDSVFAASATSKTTKATEVLDQAAAREKRLKTLAELFQTIEAKKTFSLQGRWSASVVGGHVFAIELTQEKKFKLVHLNQGKPTISSGDFNVSDTKLTLSSNGTPALVSEITWATADQFSMKIGSASVNFKRAK